MREENQILSLLRFDGKFLSASTKVPSTYRLSTELQYMNKKAKFHDLKPTVELDGITWVIMLFLLFH